MWKTTSIVSDTSSSIQRITFVELENLCKQASSGETIHFLLDRVPVYMAKRDEKRLTCSTSIDSAAQAINREEYPDDVQSVWYNYYGNKIKVIDVDGTITMDKGIFVECNNPPQLIYNLLESKGVDIVWSGEAHKRRIPKSMRLLPLAHLALEDMHRPNLPKTEETLTAVYAWGLHLLGRDGVVFSDPDKIFSGIDAEIAISQYQTFTAVMGIA